MSCIKISTAPKDTASFSASPSCARIRIEVRSESNKACPHMGGLQWKAWNGGGGRKEEAR